MADYILSFPGGIAGHFRTAHDLGADARRQLSAHVPGLSFVPVQPPGAVSLLYLEHKPSGAPHLDAGALRATLYAPEGVEFPADLPHLLYGLERKALLQQKLYPVHAACVGKDGEYMLLVGHSGAGKTTLAARLVEKDGWKLYSGNKTVVRFDADGMKAVAGTRIMTAVGKDFNRFAYEMPAADCAPEPEVKISRIALVRVNDGVQECQAISPASALHTLYPYFLDTVNADVIVNGKDVFSGAVPDITRKHLAENLGRELQSVPARRISGPMAFMQEKARTP